MVRSLNAVFDEEIDQIQNEILSVGHWELMLGIALQYEWAPDHENYSMPYHEMGKELWKSVRYELYEVLCDPKSKVPNKWLEELISGDIRSLIVGITTAITARYDVGLGIAVPTAALLIKTGLGKYCSKPSKKPKRSAADILDEKRKSFKRNHPFE